MNALTFHDTPIPIIEHGGLPWMPGPEIGRALGYEDTAAIRKLYERNSAEFDDSMTRRVKMGRRGETRVFSPRGALLLAMHASTPRAVAFRGFVLDILEGKRPLPGKADRASRLTDALMAARPRWARHLRYAEMGLTQSEIARLEGVSPALVHLDANALRNLGLISTPKHGPRGAALIAARSAGHA